MSTRFAAIAALWCAVAVRIAAAEEPAPGKQVEQSLVVKVKEGDAQKEVQVRYLLFLPETCGQGNERPPLMLFLHGAGERGDDNLPLVKKHGPPKLVDSDKKFPFVVASPQCPQNQRWDAAVLGALVDHLVAQYKTDPARLYVTGLSMGGYGSWAFAAANPDRVAAAVPICGGGEAAFGPKLKGVPIWAFHGAKDTAVSLAKSEEMVAAVKESGGDAKLTVYPEAGHDSWTETYNNPEVYKWLLSHRKEGAGK